MSKKKKSVRNQRVAEKPTAERDIAALDQKLRRFRSLTRQAPPPQGWTRAIREALGMTPTQLARRVRLSRTTVRHMEEAEAQGGIQLSSLRKLADGLGCDLVYALAPRVKLADALRQRQLALAAKDLGVAGARRMRKKDLSQFLDMYGKAITRERLWG